MANLKEAASLISELSQDTQFELYKTWQSNEDAAVSRLVEMAKEKGQTGYDAVIVKRLIEEFIAEVQKNDENEDLELKEGELMAVAGGINWNARAVKNGMKDNANERAGTPKYDVRNLKPFKPK